MRDFVYRLGSDQEPPPPATARKAIARLEKGNADFADLVSGRRPDLIRHDDMGRAGDGRPPVQSPFAAVLGCSDARVPAELVFAEGVNDLFLLRVAGNVLATECMGSLEFAAANFTESLKVVVVVGHTECGAVRAAVKAYLDPDQYLAVAPTHGLRSLVDRILVAVRMADQALKAEHPKAAADPRRYADALTGVAVPLNAALTAETIRQEFASRPKAAGLAKPPAVVYGVYDLVTQRVGLPGPDAAGFAPGLTDAPATAAELNALAGRLAAAPLVRRALAAKA